MLTTVPPSMTKVPVVSDDLAGGGVAGLLWVTAGKIPTHGVVGGRRSR
jgi:hypothetical protein